MGDDIDIVERLRAEARAHADGDWNDQVIRRRFTQAADEIVRLRAERDASRLIISDLTAQVERQRGAILLLGLADIERLAANNKRLRHAGDALAEARSRQVVVTPDPLLTAWEEARREH